MKYRAYFHPRKFLFFITLLSISISPANAQDSLINYDEAKMPPYTLPDPLQLLNGTHISTSKAWMKEQRPRMLQLFADNVYGRIPGKPKELHFAVKTIDSFALNGTAVRKEITIFFTNASGPSMEALLYLPKSSAMPVPVFMGLNFYGNQTVSKDPGIDLSERWAPNDEEKHIDNNKATDASRGTDESRWPVEEIIKRGYGLMTAYYGDLEPDYPGGWKTGIRTSMKSALAINEQEWSAMSAWAWGLSRMMDYLETDRAVDAKKVVITGHSRLGKAALWAGANDTRFAIVVSNNSGEGGAALSRRWYGETIKIINTSFPHWFITKYKQYNESPQLLPVDQHILLALMAPRPLYVASAAADKWADPKGEFLSAKNAEPVYALFGKKGLGVSELPPVDHPVGETIKYHIRNGKHDITLYDWKQYLDFADIQFEKMKPKKSR
ncbi:MAG: hypothetical protein ABI416_03235 [Ginsengibacter sp.]